MVSATGPASEATLIKAPLNYITHRGMVHAMRNLKSLIAS